MLTIFTIPKPFKGHIDIIQRNAIKSWTVLDSQWQVVLCGDDFGTEEVAKEFGIKYIPNIARNEFGTPLLSSAFRKVKNLSSNDLMCYVNCDIIFLGDLVSAIKHITCDRFLLIGNRWNIDIKGSIDFDDNDWENKIRKHVKSNGSLQPPMGADYFIFNKNEALSDIPPFAVGRPRWDNWFIYNARNKKYKVIDASEVVTAIHQNHDYNHLQGGYTKKIGLIGWEGPEVDEQSEIANDMKIFFKLLDATHILTENKLKPAIDYQHLRRRFDTLSLFYPKLLPLFKLIDEKMLPFLRKCKRRR